MIIMIHNKTDKQQVVFVIPEELGISAETLDQFDVTVRKDGSVVFVLLPLAMDYDEDEDDDWDDDEYDYWYD